MSGPHTAIADAVMSNINGQRDAQRLLHALCGGCAPADLLSEAIAAVMATGDAERNRGFARTLQKRLEGSV